MGSCCSKGDVVAVKENIGPNPSNYQMLITENIGVGNGTQGSVNVDPLHDQPVRSYSKDRIPLIESIIDLPTQESEAVNTINKQNNSAARSTLIFPSYSGYRNNDNSGFPRRNAIGDIGPTSLVSPVQTIQRCPSPNRSAVDFIVRRGSPMMSRYSPLASPVLQRRIISSAFENISSSSRIESGGFDSDLESENNEEPPDKEFLANVTTLKSTGRLLTNQESVIKNASTSLNAYEVVDACIGTDSDSFYHSSRKPGLDSSKKNLKTCDMAVGTEPVTKKRKSSVSSQSSDINQKPSKQTTKSNEADATNLSSMLVEIVDSCVGTDTDKCYRSTKTTQVLNDLSSNCSKANVAVETDPAPKTNTSAQTERHKGSKSIAGSPILSESFIKMVDVCVGTDSDDFYRSKKPTRFQVDLKKKKKLKTSSIAISTERGMQSCNASSQTKTSPRPKPKTPKILTEIEGAGIPKVMAESQTPSPTPRSTHINAKPEPHPIIETLENVFTRFARYGEVNNDGREMNNKNWAKLCRDCDFVDNRTILVGDVDVIFSRHKPKGFRLIDFEMFTNCLNEVADRRLSQKVKDEWARRKMIYQQVIGKAPELIGITGTSRTGNVNRMTDHTLYPVSHKIRFDEQGRGLGIEDKFEVHDSQLGYVMGYRDRDTYDQKMLGRPRSRSDSITSSNKQSASNSPLLLRPNSSSSRSRSPII